MKHSKKRAMAGAVLIGATSYMVARSRNGSARERMSRTARRKVMDIL